MAANPGSLQELLRALSKVFQPLQEAIYQDDALGLLAELGIEFPSELADDPGFASAIDNLGALLITLPDKAAALDSAIDSEDFATIATVTVELIDAIRRAVDHFEHLASAIAAQKNALPGLTPQEVTDYLAGFPRRLLDYLIIRQAETGVPAVGVALDFIGVFERVDRNEGSTNPLQPPYMERNINVSGALDFLQSPSDVLESRYDWGSSAFDGSTLFATAERLALELGLPAIYTPTPTPTLDLLFLSLQPRSDLSPPGIQLDLNEPLKTGTELTIPGDGWELVFASDAQIEVGSSVTVTPAGDVDITPPGGDLTGTASVVFRTVAGAGDPPFILIGEVDASRLEFKAFSALAAARLVWNAGLGRAQVDLSSQASLEEGKLVVDLAGADGFISEIAAAARLQATFDLAAGYSTADGFFFRGSGGLEVQLPVHIDLGLIEFQAVTIGVDLASDQLPVGLGADIKANLGPLQAVVEGMGVDILFSFPDDGDGNLGPMDLGLGFKPPEGVGLALDAGVVKGGGYLYFDPDNEEYAGALELVFSGFLTVKAIGLVTTRMPDGSDGFALLIIVSAEFGTPFQLGFGFTLNAVGGLLGLNRTIEIELIAEGVRSGAVESIMFPEDVIANAPRIISDLREFFPTLEDIFLIGPMAKLGWGTPTLVSASLGVILETPPGNIAIVGVLKVALPDENVPLIVIQVNFIGALEVDKRRLWFFASLYESRVLYITLEGEMGLLFAWGEDANFVLSVGGFHPTFNPPPLPFSEPKRIAISILNESFARIRIEGYFAVTSNTVQFGANVEVFFGLDEFKIEGYVGFDALFQFSPFYFLITISASLDVKVFGLGLFSVRMRGELEGTSPWHIEGEGSISLLFFDIGVPFSHTWGEVEDTTLPPIDIMPLLEAELNKLDNWTAEVPAANSLLVSLREIEAAEDLVLHPVGVLKVNQRAIPLDLDLDKVGNQTPADATRVHLEVLDADVARIADTREPFATAQFKTLSDAKKLSAPAYEKQNSGVELSVAGDQIRSASAIKRVVRYEEIIIDNNFKGHIRRFVGFALQLFTHFLAGNAASRSSLSMVTKTQKAPVDQKIKVKDANYVVASSVDNSLHSEEAQFTSQAQAEDFLRAQTAASPALAQSLHVIPAAELKDAA